MRSITCKNNNGSALVFGEAAFTPFLLAHVEGLYSSIAELSILENAMLDGGDFYGSRIPTRNIVITITDKPGARYAQQNRDTLRSVFTKGDRGTLIYQENDSQRCIDYYVESIKPGKKRLTTISLLCPDPYFYDVNYSKAIISTWIPDFEFPHEFKADGEELGHKEESRIANIEGTAPNPVGMIMEITANGQVENITVAKLSTGEHIVLGSQSHPFQMQYGDVVRIVTEDNKKNITRIRDGVEESINQYMSEDSKFFQITYGDNPIGYTADTGVDNISLEISYRNRYEGA